MATIHNCYGPIILYYSGLHGVLYKSSIENVDLLKYNCFYGKGKTQQRKYTYYSSYGMAIYRGVFFRGICRSGRLAYGQLAGFLCGCRRGTYDPA